MTEGGGRNLRLDTRRRRSQWPRGLTRGSAVARLLVLAVRFCREPGYLSVVSIVLLGRGLCVEPITHPEESYRL
jgi:hypothetical protein